MKLVSVIIPTYNVELYIDDCLNSILNQTYENIEIIIMDDGSKDRTALLVKEYQKKYDNIQLYENENHGQGYERNKALEIAKGDYILFVDSDDFIEKETIENCVKRMEMDESDIVIFDWQYYNHRTKIFTYNKPEELYSEKELVGRNTLKALKLHAYFSVNKLYRKQFLLENNIRYMEKYIYEDNPFWVEAVIKANKISIIQKPYYNVRIGNPSSTRSNRETDFHAKSYIEAIKEIQKIISETNTTDGRIQYTYNYIFKKFQNYRKERVPKELRKEFTKQFLHELRNIEIHQNYTGKVFKLMKALKVFKNEKYYTLMIIVKSREIAKALYKKVNKLRTPKNTTTSNINLGQYNLKNNIILFMGFDYRYTGNSRYLFEDIIKNKDEKTTVYFATNDKLVHDNYRIEPKSEEFYSIMEIADLVIFESWIPTTFKKKTNQVWLQLWHGTPLKKMLFDSNEKEVVEKSPKHKLNKYNDIKRWDYLLADSKEAQKYFHSPFLIPNEKVLPIGYPRVKYLVDNKNNDDLKNSIKREYDIPQDKIIVSYLPTWRDYNYKQGDEDFEYMIDVEKVQQELGDKYKVIFKDHTFLSKNDKLLKMETQELLLISDYLLTDYSSVMFDAFAIDIKTILYCNDFEKYQNSRGVYEEMWDDLKPLVVDNYKDMISLIKNYTKEKDVQIINNKYGYQGSYKRDLSKIVLGYFNKEVYNPFKKTYLLLPNSNINNDELYKKTKELEEDGFEVFIGLKEENKLTRTYAKTIIIKNEEELKLARERYDFYEVEKM